MWLGMKAVQCLGKTGSTPTEIYTSHLWLH